MFGVRNNNRRRPNAQVDDDNDDDNTDNDDDNSNDDVDNVYNNQNDNEYQVLIWITFNRQMIVMTILVIIDLMALDRVALRKGTILPWRLPHDYHNDDGDHHHHHNHHPPHHQAGDDSCREDYLMIPGGRDARDEDEARHSHDRWSLSINDDNLDDNDDVNV